MRKVIIERGKRGLPEAETESDRIERGLGLKRRLRIGVEDRREREV